MLQTFLGILSTAFFGIVAWAVSMSNRVTALETRDADLTSLLNSRFDAMAQRLDRIERKLDKKEED